MDIYVYDPSFNLIGIIDAYGSFIWTERYYSCGDFQLDMPFDLGLYSAIVGQNGLINGDYYIKIPESDDTMMIESVQVVSDVENGSKMTLTGRSLEALLDRRVVYGTTTLTGSFQNGIKHLLDLNVISPSIAARVIPDVIFTNSIDSKVTSVQVDTQFDGDNVYSAIQSLCESNKIGFRMLLNSSKRMEFELYSGVDRSYDQSVTPYIVFARDFDNLISSDYKETAVELKTVAVVFGEYETTEDEVTVRTPVIVEKEASSPAQTGLRRRELYVDGSSISQTREDETEMNIDEYKSALQGKGKEDLAEYQYKKEFSAEVESSLTFLYGQDYFMGDIVQIKNEYGIESKARVVELIRSSDTNGYREYPTFETV